jgi:hypothetical protein
MPKRRIHPRLSCQEFWHLIEELLRRKNACYISAWELGDFKKTRFSPRQYHPRGADAFECLKRFHREKRLFRYHIGRYVWLVLPTKKCIEAFLHRFPEAELESD